MNKKIRWITETAVMLALLVAVQAVTSGLGNQFVTGSCVNAVLAITTLIVGLWGGITVAVISPFAAFLVGIGPKFIQLLPGVSAGNLVLVLVLGLVLGSGKKPYWLQIAAWLGGAAVKFVTLYLVVVKLLVPTLVAGGTIPEKAAGTISLQFSWPQLVTALIGTAVALLIVPVLRKALHR